METWYLFKGLSRTVKKGDTISVHLIVVGPYEMS